MLNFIVEDHVVVKRIYHVEALNRNQALQVAADRDQADAEEVLHHENVRVAELGNP